MHAECWQFLPYDIALRINRCCRKINLQKIWRGRFKAMSTEKKYTREEIKGIVDEEIARLKGTKELSPNEMGQAAGGMYITLKRMRKLMNTGI